MQPRLDQPLAGASQARPQSVRWRWVRIGLWALLVLALTVATDVGAALDHCDPDCTVRLTMRAAYAPCAEV